MSGADDRVQSHLDTLKEVERAHREREEAARPSAAEADAAEKAARREAYEEAIATKAAREREEAEASAQATMAHRQKMDSIRTQTNQQASDVEQARIYEHEQTMTELKEKEKKTVGWAPALLVILALGGVAAAVWYGVFQPMRNQAVTDTQLERQRVVDETIKRRDAEDAKAEHARTADQEEERLRRTKQAITAAAAAADDGDTTSRGRRRGRGGGGATEEAAEEPTGGGMLPETGDPF